MSPQPHDEQAKISLFDVDASDPESQLIDRSNLSTGEISQINHLMAALGALRKAEDRLTEASTRYMKLNKTDMRALHFVIVSGNRGELATPGSIAAHLEISTASTTKLLDRLERGGHIVREPHPTDRRALVIRITPETHESAMATVGRQHAKRFAAAARLTAREREVVIGFIEDMTQEISLTDDAAWAQES